MKKCGVFSMLAILGFLFAFSGVVYADLNNGLVAYYPFNGNANDESGNGNDGTVNGATLTEDRFGNAETAYSFDGIDNYISVPDDTSLNLINELTISVWVNSRNISKVNQDIISKTESGSYSLTLNESDESDKINRFAFLAMISGGYKYYYSDTHIESDTWYHVVSVYDGSYVKIYVDGIQETIHVQDGSIQSNNSSLIIGNESRQLHEPFDGYIDDIRIYNRALSESEIQELYLEGELPENINTYFILTEDSVPLYLPKGSYVQAYGSNGINTLNVEKYARLQCRNFIGENEINIEEVSSQFTVYRSGVTVYLNSTSGTRIEIPATETPQTFRFADGSLVLEIVAGDVILGTQVVDQTETEIESAVDSSDTSESIF